MTRQNWWPWLAGANFVSRTRHRRERRQCLPHRRPLLAGGAGGRGPQPRQARQGGSPRAGGSTGSWSAWRFVPW